MSQRRDAGTLKKKKDVNYRVNSTLKGVLQFHIQSMHYISNITKQYIYPQEPILNIQVLRDAGTLPKTRNQACQ